MQPSKTRHIHIFFLYRVETWFKYQNNQQNLQIWDIPQIAKFKLRLILWEWVDQCSKFNLSVSYYQHLPAVSSLARVNQCVCAWVSECVRSRVCVYGGGMLVTNFCTLILYYFHVCCFCFRKLMYAPKVHLRKRTLQDPVIAIITCYFICRAVRGLGLVLRGFEVSSRGGRGEGG